MAKLKALRWDVDGTLVEPEHVGHRVEFNMAFATAASCCMSAAAASG